MEGMNTQLTYADRAGSLTLSLVAFTGLTCLAIFLWQVASGYVLLLLVPALAVSLYQMVLTPVYGLHLEDTRWRVMAQDGDRTIARDDIAHLRIVDYASFARATLVLTDGREVAIPFDLAPNPLELIRAATEQGIPVRTR
jgi:hypothetical protein